MPVELVLSFLAGCLSVLAPCVLPLLPVIVGGSLRPSKSTTYRSYVIIGSLLISLVGFTLLLKISTARLGFDQTVWRYISGSLVLVLGLLMLLPQLWTSLLAKAGIEHRSQALLGKAYSQKNETISAVATGIALGPVFSSCSPLYAWIIAIVLPANFSRGTVLLIAYCAGLSVTLLAISKLGIRAITKSRWASNQTGWFQRVIAILFILVGIFVISGYDKQLQTWLVEEDIIRIKSLELRLVPEDI
jgi:cytochrome c biogenesis protein CcdA